MSPQEKGAHTKMLDKKHKERAKLKEKLKQLQEPSFQWDF